MIKAKDAIRIARAQIGAPYGTRPGELDCINLIKHVIRSAPGGVKTYTTAGSNALWDSHGMSAKYRDLTWRQLGLAGARAGMLAFKISGDNVHHVGLVTGEGTVIHASSAQGETVETALDDTWHALAVHRHIAQSAHAGRLPLKGTLGDADKKEKDDMNEEILFKAVIDTVSGPLNLRELPAQNAIILEKMPKGEIVDVLEKTDLEWWKVRYRGEIGYAAEEYMSRVQDEEIQAGEEGGLTVQTVITDEAGNAFRPVGAFVVNIEMLLDGKPLEEAESID